MLSAATLEVQQKGQEEMDRAIGKDRLLTFDDRDKLPYDSAICSEIRRCARYA